MTPNTQGNYVLQVIYRGDGEPVHVENCGPREGHAKAKKDMFDRIIDHTRFYIAWKE